MEKACNNKFPQGKLLWIYRSSKQKKGTTKTEETLNNIVLTCPDVIFISGDELGYITSNDIY